MDYHLRLGWVWVVWITVLEMGGRGEWEGGEGEGGGRGCGGGGVQCSKGGWGGSGGLESLFLCLLAPHI